MGIRRTGPGLGILLTLGLGLSMAICVFPGSKNSDRPLPKGWEEGLSMHDVNWGVAAHYPNDEGIQGDPSVIAAEDFEGHGTILTHLRNQLTVVTDNPCTGSHCGLKLWPPGEDGGSGQGPI